MLPEPRSWDSAMELEPQSEELSAGSWHQGGDSVDASDVTGGREEERNTLPTP